MCKLLLPVKILIIPINLFEGHMSTDIIKRPYGVLSNVTILNVKLTFGLQLNSKVIARSNEPIINTVGEKTLINGHQNTSTVMC